METYILLADFLKDTSYYLNKVKEDERFVIQSDDGETLAVLVSETFSDNLEKLSKQMKVKVI